MISLASAKGPSMGLLVRTRRTTNAAIRWPVHATRLEAALELQHRIKFSLTLP